MPLPDFDQLYRQADARPVRRVGSRWVGSDPTGSLADMCLTLADDNYAVRVAYVRAAGERPRGVSLLTRPRHQVERALGPYGVRIDNLLSMSRSFVGGGSVPRSESPDGAGSYRTAPQGPLFPGEVPEKRRFYLCSFSAPSRILVVNYAARPRAAGIP